MLELKNINYIVHDERGEKQILKDVNLTLDERFVAFTGPNGGGKSTLAKIIAGILQPTSGRIYLDGEDITDLSVTDRAKKGVSFGGGNPHFALCKRGSAKRKIVCKPQRQNRFHGSFAGNGIGKNRGFCKHGRSTRWGLVFHRRRGAGTC